MSDFIISADSWHLILDPTLVSAVSTNLYIQSIDGHTGVINLDEDQWDSEQLDVTNGTLGTLGSGATVTIPVTFTLNTNPPVGSSDVFRFEFTVNGVDHTVDLMVTIRQMLTKKCGNYVYVQPTNAGNQYVDADPSTFAEELFNRPRRYRPVNVEGQYSEGGLIDYRKLTLAGVIVGTNNQDLTRQLEIFKGAHCPGILSNFYLNSDKYIIAEIESVAFAEWDSLPHVNYTVVFQCNDIYWRNAFGKSRSLTVSTSATATTQKIVSSGTAHNAPVIRFHVTAAPAGSYIQVTNNTNGQTCAIATQTNLGYFDIDCEQELVNFVVYNVDTGQWVYTEHTEFFVGEFMFLEPGENDLSIAMIGGVEIDLVQIFWRDSWI